MATHSYITSTCTAQFALNTRLLVQFSNGEVFSCLTADVSYFIWSGCVQQQMKPHVILMHLNTPHTIHGSRYNRHPGLSFDVLALFNWQMETRADFQCTLAMWRCTSFRRCCTNRPEQNSMYNSELGFKWPLEQYIRIKEIMWIEFVASPWISLFWFFIWCAFARSCRALCGRMGRHWFWPVNVVVVFFFLLFRTV